jgi:hypothetical protein
MLNTKQPLPCVASEKATHEMRHSNLHSRTHMMYSHNSVRSTTLRTHSLQHQAHIPINQISQWHRSLGTTDRGQTTSPSYSCASSTRNLGTQCNAELGHPTRCLKGPSHVATCTAAQIVSTAFSNPDYQPIRSKGSKNSATQGLAIRL